MVNLDYQNIIPDTAHSIEQNQMSKIKIIIILNDIGNLTLTCHL